MSKRSAQVVLTAVVLVAVGLLATNTQTNLEKAHSSQRMNRARRLKANAARQLQSNASGYTFGQGGSDTFSTIISYASNSTSGYTLSDVASTGSTRSTGVGSLRQGDASVSGGAVTTNLAESALVQSAIGDAQANADGAALQTGSSSGNAGLQPSDLYVGITTGTTGVSSGKSGKSGKSGGSHSDVDYVVVDIALTPGQQAVAADGNTVGLSSGAAQGSSYVGVVDSIVDSNSSGSSYGFGDVSTGGTNATAYGGGAGSGSFRGRGKAYYGNFNIGGRGDNAAIGSGTADLIVNDALR